MATFEFLFVTESPTAIQVKTSIKHLLYIVDICKAAVINYYINDFAMFITSKSYLTQILA